MSRIGKKPIEISDDIKVGIKDGRIAVEGPKGKLSFDLPHRVSLEMKDKLLFVKSPLSNKQDKSLHGLVRSLIANMVKGVSQGYTKGLEIQGVGFKASVSGDTLSLILGFSHPVLYGIPPDIKIELPKPTQIIVKGVDKQLVGEVAAQIRRIFPPEPYKGKGIRYQGEFVRRKLGKAATK